MIDNLCEDCLYCEQDGNLKPCNSCIQWIDGYLTATNYTNKFIVTRGKKEDANHVKTY